MTQSLFYLNLTFLRDMFLVREVDKMITLRNFPFRDHPDIVFYPFVFYPFGNGTILQSVQSFFIESFIRGNTGNHNSF